MQRECMLFPAFCVLPPICSSERSQTSSQSKARHQKNQKQKYSPRPPVPVPPVLALLSMISNAPDPAHPFLSRSQEQQSICIFLTPTLVLTTFHSVNFAQTIRITTKSFASEGQLVHTCPVADLALVKLSNEFLELKSSPLFSQIPSTCQYSLHQLYSGLNVEFGLKIDRRKAFLPVHQTLPFLITDKKFPVQKGWSGIPVLTPQKEIAGILQGVDPCGKAYIVPSSFIRRFFASFPGRQTTFGLLPIKYQTLDDQLERYFNLPPGICGVRVSQSMTPVLYEDDIITSIDGYRITSNGLLLFEKNVLEEDFTFCDTLQPLMGSFQEQKPNWPWTAPIEYYCALKPFGTKVNLQVIRNTFSLNVEVNLKELVNGLERPVDRCYVNIRGYIFTTLRVAYLREWGKDWQSTCPTRLMAMATGVFGTNLDPVILSGLSQLTHEEVEARRSHAQTFTDAVVISVNGYPVDNLETFKRHAQSAAEEIVIKFDSGDILVI